MLQRLGVERRHTSAYHPRTNGLAERTNASLVEMLRLHAGQRPSDWPLFLDYCLLAYRTRRHTSTGATPFSLMYGREHNSLTKAYLDEPSILSSEPLALLQRATEIRRQVGRRTAGGRLGATLKMLNVEVATTRIKQPAPATYNTAPWKWVQSSSPVTPTTCGERSPLGSPAHFTSPELRRKVHEPRPQLWPPPFTLATIYSKPPTVRFSQNRIR